MNNYKNANLNIDKKSLGKSHQKIISKKCSVDNLNNIFLIQKKDSKNHSKSKKI